MNKSYFMSKSIMVHKSLEWNLTEEKMLQLIHLNLIEILKENGFMMEMNHLISTLNERTKNHIIHKNKKYSVSKYIKINYGGILKFIDTYTIYGISEERRRRYIHLLDATISDPFQIGKRITSDNEWEQIEIY